MNERMIRRRGFLETAAMAGGTAVLGGCTRPFCGDDGKRVPYGDTVGDRLWMWGHHSMAFASLQDTYEAFNLPFDRRIDMAAACREMDIPGCFVVRWCNLPQKADLPEYMNQFNGMKRVGFSITDNAVEEFDEKVRLGLEYADTMPNLTTLIMDDYWCGGGELQQSLAALRAVKKKLGACGMKLSVVLYSDENGVKAEQKEVIDLCDEVTFWFWHGKNTFDIESQVAKLRALAGPDKPVLLGQYMWDFGGGKPMAGTVMENQLAQTSRLLAAKAISGVIFHCTPLVDMDLDAVKVSKAWIRENKSRKWGA